MKFDDLVDDAEAESRAPASGATVRFDDLPDDEDTYGSLGQQVKTGLEGAASAATFGLSTGLERAMGVNPEDIRLRRETNPGTHMAGQVAGLVGSAFVPILGEVNAAKALGGAGALATRAAGLGAAESLAGRAAAGAVSAAAENALFQAGDEVSKMLSSDPHQSVQTALADVGASALFGGAIGAPLGAAPKMWKAAGGEKLGQFIEDFRGRIKSHVENPNPVDNVMQELDQLYHGTKSVADEVYGPTGVKAQEIQKLMPEMSEKITSQVGELVSATQKTIEKLGDDPLANRLGKRLAEFNQSIAGEVDPMTGGIKRAATPAEIFEAAQAFKQELQSWSKFSKIAPPAIAEREFIRAAKDLSHTFRTALEDSGVWGKVAERQGVINKAFSEYLPTLKNFESKFTTEIAGERVIDPGKVTTFLNQTGKMSGAVKREMLGNFIEAAEKYKKVIGDSHFNLGLESPIQSHSMAALKDALQELTPGAKLADTMVKKGLANLAGQGTGAVVGGAMGSAVGAPGIGAIVGQHALGPFFSSILPGIAKAVLDNPSSAAGLRGASEFGLAVIKGEAAINKGARAVFKSAREALPSTQTNVSQNDLDRLEKKMAAAEKNPEALLSIGQDAGHYMPAQAAAMAETAGRIMNYLGTVKPAPVKLAPLDEPIEPTKEQEETYRNALSIADKPLSILAKIQDNTLLPEDVKALVSMYPDLYTKLSQSLTNAMIEETSKGETVPYKLKQGLSLFLGQALDSTLTPMGIQAAQATFMVQRAQPNPNVPQKQSKDKSKLSDMTDRYQTSLQAADQRRATPS